MYVIMIMPEGLFQSVVPEQGEETVKIRLELKGLP
jgi:hypothetical protein